MPIKKLLHSCDTIRSLRTTIRCHEQLIRDIQSVCKHDGEILGHQPNIL